MMNFLILVKVFRIIGDRRENNLIAFPALKFMNRVYWHGIGEEFAENVGLVTIGRDDRQGLGRVGFFHQ